MICLWFMYRLNFSKLMVFKTRQGPRNFAFVRINLPKINKHTVT